MFLLIRLVINIVAFLVISYLFPKVIRVDGFWAAFVTALVLGIINAFIRPIIAFLTLPLTILTLGLFLLVINGLLLGLVAALLPGFHVNGFWGAVLGSILISIVSWVLSWSYPNRKARGDGILESQDLEAGRVSSGDME